MIKTCCLLVTLVGFSLVTNAQQKQGAWWMFGDSLSINFNKQPLQVDTGLVQTAAYRPAFCDTTISDAKGNLLFYSDGLTISNRNRLMMPNGFLYAGTFTYNSQANLIVNRPGSNQEYFFFNMIGGLYPNPISLTYSLIDMRLDNGRGDVVAGMKNITLLAKSGQRLAVLQHANNTDYWLVSSSRNSDTLYTYPITSAGIGTPIATPLTFSLVTCIHSSDCYTNKLKSSPDSEWLAANYKQGIELFRFNRSTGAIAPYASLTTGSNPAQVKVTCVAFSADNSKLYAGETNHNFTSIYSQASNFFQFDLSAGSTAAAIQNSRVLVDSLKIGRILDLQLDINGKLHILPFTGDTLINPQQNWMSFLHCPDLKAPACRLQKKGLELFGRFGGTQLPSLNQTLFRNTSKLQALAMRDTICFGDSVQLSAFGAAADRFRWFPSGVADTLASPFVRPLQTTTYTVIGFSACRQDTAQVTVTVLPAFTPKTITGPTSVCPGVQQVSYRLTNPLAGENYFWGVTDGTIAAAYPDSVTVNWGNLNASAAVWVIPQNSQGCSGDTAFLPVQVELALATPIPVGPVKVCATGQVEVYEVTPKVNGSVYTWGIKGGNITGGQGSSKISVNWQRNGTKKLWVQESSQTILASCRGVSDTLHISVLPADTTKLKILAVSIDSLDEGKVNISYNVNQAANFPVTKLNLDRQLNGSWQNVASLATQSGNAIDIISSPAQRYSYRLQSQNRCDSILYSLSHTTVLLQTADQQKEKVTLKWSAYNGWGTEPVTYQVWQKTENEPTYQLIPTLTTTDTSATATIAGIGFKPCFRVKAIGDGQQSWSNSICLEVANLPEFYNIITPNSDGLNDSFSIKNLNLYPNSHLQIFNRWGQQVFISDDYQNNWPKEQVSSGIYFYRFTTAGGQSYKGWVEVIR